MHAQPPRQPAVCPSSFMHAGLALGLSLCITAPGPCGEPSPGKLYYVNTSCSTIYRMDLADPDPQPVHFLAGSNRWQLALHGCKMYWSDLDLDRIQRSNWDGSGVVNLIENFGETQGVAIDPVAEKLYFTTVFNGQNAVIRKANLDGSNPEVILPLAGPSAAQLTLDMSAGKMYWNQGGSGLWRANLDGTDLEPVVASSAARSFALDLGAGHIYFAEFFSGAANDVIRRANLDGSNPQAVLTGLETVGSVAVDSAGGKIYWGDLFNRVILRANLDGSQVEQLTPYETCFSVGFCMVSGDVDAACGPPDPCPPKANCEVVDAVYWAEGSSNGGRIWRANPDGTGIQAVVQTARQPTSVAIDRQAGKVYWTAVSSCADGQCSSGEPSWNVFRSNLDGSSVEPLVNLPYVANAWVTGVALDTQAGKMYFTRKRFPNSLTMGTIYRANLDGTGVEVFLTWNEPADPCIAVYPATGTMDQPALDVANGWLYFMIHKRIVRARLDQSQPPQTIIDGSPSNSAMRGLALDLDADKIYWYQEGINPACPPLAPWLLMRANLDGSNVEQVAVDNQMGRYIALDTVTRRMYTCGSTGPIIRANMQDLGDQFLVIYIGAVSYHGIALLMDVPAPIPGDITGDGVVNINDLLAVVGTWGPCPAPPTPCPTDIAPAPNGDGVVNVNDLLMVIGNWS